MRKALAPLAAAALSLAGVVLVHGDVRAEFDPTTEVFVSELHYNGNSNEQIEVTGPAEFDLAGWSIWVYDGSSGSSGGNSLQLSGLVPGSPGELGAVVVGAGLVNGLPDDSAGIALVDDSNAVVQFLSYEGSFTANDGPAAGLQATDIGVFEDGGFGGSTSLQLVHVGPGSGQLGDYEWAGPLQENFGIPPVTTSPPGEPTAAVGEFTLVDAPGPCIVIAAGTNVSFPDLTIGSGDAAEGDVDTEIESCSTNTTDPQAVTQSITDAVGVASSAALRATLCPTVPIAFVLPGSAPTFDCGGVPASDEFGYGGYASTDLTNWQSVVDGANAFAELSVEAGGSTTVAHAVIAPDVGAVADTYQFQVTYTAFFA